MKLQLEAAEHVLQGRNAGGGREGEAWDVSGHIPGRSLLGEATPGWLLTAKPSRILTFLFLSWGRETEKLPCTQQSAAKSAAF